MSFENGVRIILQGKRRRKRRGRRRDNLKKNGGRESKTRGRECQRERERERKEDEGENIAEKVKKKNTIKIQEGLRSYFTLHSDGKNAGGTLNLGERKNNLTKKEAAGESGRG